MESAWLEGRLRERDKCRRDYGEFYQEIYDAKGEVVEIHQKYPIDTGRQQVDRGGACLTRDAVAQKIIAYLHHKLQLADLVDWAEQAMMQGDFEEEHFAVIHDMVSRLGLADVLAFGLTWEDLEDFLSRLGYEVRIEVLEIA